MLGGEALIVFNAMYNSKGNYAFMLIHVPCANANCNFPLLPLPFSYSLSWPLAVVGKLIPVPKVELSNFFRRYIRRS